jgi:hypothetical protein
MIKDINQSKLNSKQKSDAIKELIIKDGGKCMTKQEIDELLKNNISEEDFIKWFHLLVMIFAQLTQRESLRDLIASLSAHKSKFNRLGFGESVTRSNLSKANEQRDPRIFEDFAYILVEEARRLRAGDVDDTFFYQGNVYAFDSTTISLCLQTFWWSRLHHDKGAVKFHSLYDVKADVPSFFVITNGDLHDSKVMHMIPYEQDSLYIFDRAYMVTDRLHLKSG